MKRNHQHFIKQKKIFTTNGQSQGYMSKLSNQPLEMINQLSNTINQPNALKTKNMMTEYNANNMIRCYYHPQCQINFFCKNKNCTLPLCSKCLPIHRGEHLERKQIPMQNVITFNQSKQYILKKLKQNKAHLNSNQSNLDKKITAYHQQLISTIASAIKMLKQQISTLDNQTSQNKLKQIDYLIKKIQKQNSPKYTIEAYQKYGNQIGSSQDVYSNISNELKFINRIHFIVDQINIIQVIKNGCRNINLKNQIQISSPKKIVINRQEYLNSLVQSPNYKYQNSTPIATLISPRMETLSHQKEYDLKQSPFKVQDQQRTILKQQVKRQDRKIIFEKDKNKIDSPHKRNNAEFLSEPLFSDVKKYEIQEADNQNKRTNNIYTQPIYLGKIKKQSHIISGQSSQSSIEVRKGLSLIDKNYLNITNTRKKSQVQQNLRTQGNHQRIYQSLSSKKSIRSNWRKVVNLSESNSFKNIQQFKDNVINFGKTSNIFLKNNDEKNNINPYIGRNNYPIIKNSFETDILDPLQMRELLLKKSIHKKSAN